MRRWLRIPSCIPMLRWTSDEILGDIDISEVEMCELGHAPTIVSTIDNFARAKVLNFIKRSTGGHSVDFECQTVLNNIDDSSLYRVRVKLPVPPEYGVRYGEGLAANQKDAEALASMHAERLIDALGLQMYALPSTQHRHAEAARRAGRWAPLPSEAPRGADTPTPPPLQLSDHRRKGGGWAKDAKEGLEVFRHPRLSLRKTIATPKLMDPSAAGRLIEYFSAHGMRMHHRAKFFPTDGGVSTVCRIELVHPVAGAPCIASGKSTDRRIAFVLACMHAELCIDALGLPLFPMDASAQAVHHEECIKMGRKCAPAGKSVKSLDVAVEMPPPLIDTGRAMSTADGEAAVTELERNLHRHAVARDAQTVVVTVPPARLNRTLRYVVAEVLNIKVTEIPFVSEAHGIEEHETFRTSLLLKMPNGEIEMHAVGIAPSNRDSEDLCSVHALCLYYQHGVTLSSDEQRQRSVESVLLHHVPTLVVGGDPIPPLRLGADRVGRLYFGSSATVSDTSQKSSAVLDDELAATRRRVPPSFWSLEADMEGRIVIPPTATMDGVKLYIHTMTSPRLPDPKALLRLTDFLERGGSTLERMAIAGGGRGSGGPSSSIFTATVPLPLPERFGARNAVGEGYTVHAARVACALHAELSIDALGVPLYDHPPFQNAHAEAARSVGRWAPFPNTPMKPGDAPQPPPVRWECATSPTWAQYLAKSAESPASQKEVEEKDDDLEKFIPPPSDFALFVQQRTRRVKQFLQRVGTSADAMDVYSRRIFSPQRKCVVYFATIDFALPDETKVTARGCGMTRRSAFFLCCAHIEWILLAKGISIMPRDMEQRIYLQHATSDWKWLIPKGTTLYHGFCGVSKSVRIASNPFDDADPPELPEDENNVGEWNAYVRSVIEYAFDQHHRVLMRAAASNKSPRWGVPIEDETLDIVEAVPINHRGRHSLIAYCTPRRIPVPQMFEYRNVKLPNMTMRYCVAQIEGTPFHAYGMAAKPDDARNRCAMHFHQILQRISITTSTGNAAAALSGTLFDATKNTLTSEGRAAAVRLHFILQEPHRVISLTEKPRGAGVQVSAEAQDVGLKVMGRGEAPTREAAASAALCALHGELSKRNSRPLQMVSRVVQTLPNVMIDYISMVVIDTHLVGAMRSWLTGKAAALKEYVSQKNETTLPHEHAQLASALAAFIKKASALLLHRSAVDIRRSVEGCVSPLIVAAPRRSGLSTLLVKTLAQAAKGAFVVVVMPSEIHCQLALRAIRRMVNEKESELFEVPSCSDLSLASGKVNLVALKYGPQAIKECANNGGDNVWVYLDLAGVPLHSHPLLVESGPYNMALEDLQAKKKVCVMVSSYPDVDETLSVVSNLVEGTPHIIRCTDPLAIPSAPPPSPRVCEASSDPIEVCAVTLAAVQSHRRNVRVVVCSTGVADAPAWQKKFGEEWTNRRGPVKIHRTDTGTVNDVELLLDNAFGEVDRIWCVNVDGFAALPLSSTAVDLLVYLNVPSEFQDATSTCEALSIGSYRTNTLGTSLPAVVWGGAGVDVPMALASQADPSRPSTFGVVVALIAQNLRRCGLGARESAEGFVATARLLAAGILCGTFDRALTYAALASSGAAHGDFFALVGATGEGERERMAELKVRVHGAVVQALRLAQDAMPAFEYIMARNSLVWEEGSRVVDRSAASAHVDSRPLTALMVAMASDGLLLRRADGRSLDTRSQRIEEGLGSVVGETNVAVALGASGTYAKISPITALLTAAPRRVVTEVDGLPLCVVDGRLPFVLEASQKGMLLEMRAVVISSLQTCVPLSESQCRAIDRTCGASWRRFTLWGDSAEKI